MLGFEIENLIYIIIPGAVIVFLISVYLLLRKKPSKAKEKINKIDQTPIAVSDYQFLVDRILKLSDKHKSIIFTATNISSLPTTIPVNVAIELSKNEVILSDSYTSPVFRGQGLYSRLTAYMANEMLEKNFKVIAVCYRENRTVMRALKKLGFKLKSKRRFLRVLGIRLN